MIYQIELFAWRVIKASLRRVGVEIFLQKSGYDYILKESGYHYVPDYYGRSAHKHIDICNLPEFGELATKVILQNRTLLYYDRLYTVYQALTNLRDMVGVDDPVHLAEVGVYKGGTSYFIAAAVNALGFKDATLYCFDTFEGHVQEDIQAGLDLETVHKPGVFGDTTLVGVKEYLGEFSNIRFYPGRFQDTCSQSESGTFHFVHLDVDIYAPTIFALQFFASRLVPGGVMVVDDYGFTTCPGVRQAVDEFMDTKPGYSSMHMLTGQCVLVRYEGGQ